jgi:flagellin-specific chaperone FliS
VNSYQKHSIEAMVNGWTRVEMLVALYDRAITTIEVAQRAEQQGDTSLLATKMLEANRFLLALHAGLNTEVCGIAKDVARLLNFVMLRLGQHNFDEAIRFLKELQSSFEQIQEQAMAMEKSGEIPPLNEARGLNTIA